MAHRPNAPSPALRRALTRPGSVWRDLWVALAGVAVCTAVRLLLTPVLGPDYTYEIFYPAVMAAGAVAGPRSALIALLASGLIVWGVFIPPPGFAMTREELAGVGIYFVTAGLCGAFAAFLRHTLLRLWESEDRQRLLAEELNHRVKNALSTAIALATLTAPRSPEMKTFLSSFSDRLNAMARANDLLARAGWDATDLTAVLELELAPLREHVDIHGPPLRIAARAAASLSMIIHELATNSMKYGALSGKGRVDVAWRIEKGPSGPRVRLTWVETGGPVVEDAGRRPAGGGFGSQLITRIAKKELGGSASLDLRREGLRAEIDFLPGA